MWGFLCLCLWLFLLQCYEVDVKWERVAVKYVNTTGWWNYIFISKMYYMLFTQRSEEDSRKNIYPCDAKPKLLNIYDKSKSSQVSFKSFTGKMVILKFTQNCWSCMLSSKCYYEQCHVMQHSVFCDRVDWKTASMNAHCPRKNIFMNCDLEFQRKSFLIV